jgi:hypothetical protein
VPTRLGVAQGDLVLEVGYDSDCDEELRTAIKAITGVTTAAMTDVLGSDSSDSTWFNNLFISTGVNTFSGITYGVYVTGLT